MADSQNRKVISTPLSADNVEKLKTLSQQKGVPRARVIDEAVDELYQKMEANPQPRHKGVTLCLANNKGGIGKTTTTAAFAHLLAKKGKRVLVIDADPQGNLSMVFRYMPQTPEDLRDNYIGALLRDRMDNVGTPDNARPITDFICSLGEFPRIDLICADLRLDGIYSELNAGGMKYSFVIADIINEIRALDVYDYILIDCRPAMNNEVAMFLAGTDNVIIPVEPALFSVLGANAMAQFVAQNRRVNKNLKILGVFMTKVKDNTSSFHGLQPMVKEGWDKKLFRTTIPYNQDAINSENVVEPVTYRKPACKASKAYAKLIEEVVERIG